MGDIGERSSVYESCRIFGGLYEVRIDGVFEQHSYGSRYAEVFDCKRLTFGGICKGYVFYTATQVFEVLCQTQYSH